MDAIHKYWGINIQEWMEGISSELETDAIGLHEIVGVGESGFNLKDKDLHTFVQQSIRMLLKAGGIAVRHRHTSGYEWSAEGQYGSDAEEIITNILEEWKRLGNDPLTLSGQAVWFARPRPGKRYVEL